MVKQTNILTSLALISFILFNLISCNSDKKDEQSLNNEITVKLIDSINNQKHQKDSLLRAHTFEMYEIIKGKIGNELIEINNPDSYIQLDIDPSPIIHFSYGTKETTINHTLIDLKNNGDSLILTTSNRKSDSTFIWTFIPSNNNKSKWTLFKPQLNKYFNLGTFRAQQ